MLQRLRFSLWHLLLLGAIVTLLTAPLHSQTAVPDASGRLVFKANVRTVVLDVVVTGRDGKPVQGLRKEDFQIAEDGHSQAITFFEEHSGAHPVTASESSLPPLPPNIFTNIPRVPPSDAVTVLLLDSMNTQLQDQSFVHAQMIKYLKNIPPGTRMAIFTLGNSLGYVQGFTDDASELSAALRNPKLGGGPVSSPLLSSLGGAAANQQLTSQMQQSAAQTASPEAAAAAAAMQQFMAEQSASQNDLRVKTTLEAFQELAGYLAGIPGRKNVIWFSSAFPLVLFPDPELRDAFAVSREYDPLVRKTDAMLAGAQVAVFPVAAEGNSTDSLYDAEGRFQAKSTAPAQSSQTSAPTAQPESQQRIAQNMEIGSLQQDSVQRNANHTAMQIIARDTGGVATVNTNGLSEAVAHVIDQGSFFYTMTYTPTNTATDGKYRKIQVKLSRDDSGDKLAYRRGYYAADTKQAKAEADKPVGDPLHPFMGPGMPNTTQIPLALRVQRIATPSAAAAADAGPSLQKRNRPPTASQGGDNPNLKGPLTRYRVDFVIAASGLELDPNPDGSRHGKIEATIVIYDHEGVALNWMVRSLDLDMDAARYAQVKANGVNFNLDIDVPNGGVILRSGVFDLNANFAGTVEVPLSRVVGPAQNSHL
jgi:VWFA-related protein